MSMKWACHNLEARLENSKGTFYVLSCSFPPFRERLFGSGDGNLYPLHKPRLLRVNPINKSKPSMELLTTNIKWNNAGSSFQFGKATVNQQLQQW
jgi:hypothetical protein